MQKDFSQAVENRRTIYAIGKEPVVPPDQINELVRHSVKHAPSAFNSQSARVIVLFGEHHEKLWDITLTKLKEIVPPDNFESTQSRIASFKAGYGTILFFEDQSVIAALQQQFALYREHFPVWSLESQGMLQYIVWTGLEDLGLGASLQHYNPLIDADVRAEWNAPDNWKLLAQMPFGKRLAPADAKDYLPLDARIKTFE